MSRREVSDHKYGISLFIAVIVHVGLLSFLFFEIMPVKQYRFKQASTKLVAEPIKAVAVDEKVIDQQIAAIHKREADIKAAKLRKIEAERRHALALKRQKIEKKRRIAELKARQVALKKARIAQAQAQAKAKARQRAIEKQKHQLKLENLAKQQKALQDKLFKQQLAAERQLLAKQHAEQMRGVINKYRAIVLHAIELNWHFPKQNDNIFCQYLVRLAPGGEVLSLDLVKSSGSSALDRLAKVAILKSSPLPVPKDPALFDQFRQFRIKMAPGGGVKGA